MGRGLALLMWLLLWPLAATAQEMTAQEEQDSGLIASFVARNLSGDSRDVVISGFDGALSSRASIRVMTVSDADGVWLRLEGLVLDWDRGALLGGRIEIAELSAAQITILRAPDNPNTGPSPEASAFALPDLPVSVNIESIRADRITLGAPLLGEEVSFDLTGKIALAGGEGSAEVLASRLDGQTGQFAIAGAYSNLTRVLALDMDLSEAPDGIIARLLNLPGRPAVDLVLTGTAPIDSYGADLSIATDGVERISGQLGLAARPDADGGPPGRAFSLDIQGDVTPLLAPRYSDFFGPDVHLVVQGQQSGDGAASLTTLEITTASLTLAGSADFSAAGWPERFSLQGQIGAADGGPVLLPVAGAATTVQEMTLAVGFDAASGDVWTGDFKLVDFARPGLRIPNLTLTGDGTIIQETATTPGRFSANLGYAALGIALDDAALARALGDALTGQISLSRAGDGPVEIASLTLDGPGIEADVQGSIAGADAGFATASTIALVAADAARFDLLTGLALGGAADVVLTSTILPLAGAFDLSMTGGTTDLALGISALDPLLRGEGTIQLRADRDESGTRISTFAVTTPALTATGSADLTNGVSSAGFDLTIADVATSLPGLSGPARLEGKASRNAAGAITVDLNATLPGADAIVTLSRPGLPVTAQGDPEAVPEFIADQPFRTEVFAAIPDLAAFADLAGSPLEGAVTVGLNGTVTGNLTGLDLTLSGNSTDLALGVAPLDPALAGAGVLAGRMVRDDAGRLRLNDLTITTPALTVRGAASLLDGAAEASFDLALADAALSLPALDGPARLNGTLTRSAAGDLMVDLNASLMAAQAIVSLARPSGQPLQIEAFADLTDLGRFAGLSGLDLGGQATVGATGTALPDLSQFDLTLSGTSQDLSAGIPALDRVMAGAGILEARVQRDGPEALRLDGLVLRTAALTASGSASLDGGVAQAGFDLRLTDVALLTPGLTGGARVAGTATRAADGAIRIEANAGGPGAIARLTAAQAAGAQVLDTEISMTIASLAPYARAVGLQASGGIDGSVIGTVALDFGQFDLTLAAQTRNLDIGNPTLARLLAGTGTLAGRFIRTLGSDGGVLVEGVEARFPNIAASGTLDGRGGAGTAVFQARLTDIGLFTPEFSGPVTADGTARRDGAGNWQIDTQATGPGGTTATIAGQIGPGGALDLTASGAVPLALVNGAIEPRRISGQAGFDLALRGTARLDSLSGTVSIGGARLTDPGLGRAISAIAGTVTLAGGQARLDLSGGLEGGGLEGGGLEGGGGLTLTGGVGLSAPFSASLTVGLTQVLLRDPTLYETTASGTITVTGPLAGGAVIAGVIDLGVTEVQVPSSGVSALGDLPVVRHLDPPADVRLTLDRAGLLATGGVAESGSGGRAYALDLTIRAPSRVFIRGRGLDAELGGQVRLGGTTRNVIPTGQFDLVRGRLSILQQRFDLTEGSASLQGNFVPVIRLVARTTARTGTVISIIVDGPITEPAVTFVSAPELPQDEVLAQLIFGRDLGSITPLQAIQLAAAVGTLAGRGGGGLIEGFRTGLGVDDFEVTSDAQGNAALRIGKYLGDNLYTDVTVSSGATEINLNLDLTEDITIKAGVSSDGDTGLGIYFERDY